MVIAQKMQHAVKVIRVASRSIDVKSVNYAIRHLLVGKMETENLAYNNFGVSISQRKARSTSSTYAYYNIPKANWAGLSAVRRKDFYGVVICVCFLPINSRI
jgi:hypothetical protein